MKKDTFIDKMFEAVREVVPLDDVLGERIQLQRSGMNHLALCPFHADRKIGSFVSTNRKKMWKCFSCGAAGDVIKFVSQFDEVNYLKAAFELALEYKIITQAQYETHFLKRTYSKKDIDSFEFAYNKAEEEPVNPIAKSDILDVVFRLFIEQATLSKEHMDHLLNVRKLTKERIKEGLYFTFPERSILPAFLQSVETTCGTLDVLEEIPGFFKRKKTNEWTFSGAQGLGIGIRNSKDEVIGIQIRRDEDKSPRYFWFSSSFAIDADDLEHGTSSGSPVDIIFPEVIKNATVLVTEGRFKSEILAQATGSVVISVQGVTTWRGIVSELKLIPNAPEVKLKTKNYKIRSVMTAFDADVSENIPVYQQLKRMTDAIQREYTVFYLYWDSKYGKGVDDMIINGHQRQIGRFDKPYWDKLHGHMIEMMGFYTGGKDPLQVEKEIVEDFFTRYMCSLPPLKKGEISYEDNKRREKEKEEAANVG